MQHNISFRRILFGICILVCVNLTFSQVTIKERIEIRPVQTILPSTRQAPDQSLLFEPSVEPNQRYVQTHRACIITASCTLPPYTAKNVPADLVALTLICNGTPQPEYWLGTSNIDVVVTPPVSFKATPCATMGVYAYVGQMGDLAECVLFTGSDRATFLLTGTWRRETIHASVTLTAIPDPDFDLASLDISASPSRITQCADAATLTISARNAVGQPYTGATCNQNEHMTVTIPSDSKATLEYQRGETTIAGKELSIDAGVAQMTLRWDFGEEVAEDSVVATATCLGQTAKTTVYTAIDATPPQLWADGVFEVRHGLKTSIGAGLIDACGKTVTLPGTTTFKFEITDAPQFGYLCDPATGESGVVLSGVGHVEGTASVEYRAYGEDPSDWQLIPVRISITDPSFSPVEVFISVRPNDLQVIPARSSILFGESTLFTVERKTGEGAGLPIPGDWPSAFQLFYRDTNGYLYSPDGSQSGSTVSGLFQSAYYYAKPRQIEPDSVDVAVFVTAVDPNVVPCVANNGEKPQLLPITKKTSNSGTKGARLARTKSTLAMDEPPDLGPGLPYYGVGRLVVKKKGEIVDHFLMLTTRDTMAHDDAIVFIVIAQSADNKEVFLDSNKVVTLSVDSSQYGSYLIGDTGNAVSKELQIRYGLARGAVIQYVSDGINPILTGPKTLNFQVWLKDDPTRRGSAKVTIREKAIMTVRFTKSELKPLGDAHNKKADPSCVSLSEIDTCRRIIDFSQVETCSVILTVKDRLGNGVAQYPFWIQTGVRDSSGGHDHSAGRPTGRLVTSNKDTIRLFHGVTERDGRATFKYLCSGFGGIDSIYVEGLTKTDTATKTMTLRFGEFDSLSEGEHYRLVGQYGMPHVTSQHRRNHFGTSELVKTLKQLADSAYSYASWILQYNDMSLQLGGPFDIGNTWETPHQNHRQGKSVDLRPVSLDGDLIDTEWLETKVVKIFGGKLQEEAKGMPGHHFHLTF